MKLTLKNIGNIGTALVEIDGITVIAGENNTGKSTVGRALFAVFNSFSRFQNQVENERISIIKSSLEGNLISFNRRFKAGVPLVQIEDASEIAKNIVSHMDEYRTAELSAVKQYTKDLLSQYAEKIMPHLDDYDICEVASRIQNILSVSDTVFLKSSLTKNLCAEFNWQICNIFSDDGGEIQLRIKNSDITVSIENKNNIDFQNPDCVSLHTEVIYIDDPFVLDDTRWFPRHSPIIGSNHTDHLREKLFGTDIESKIIDEVIAKKKLDHIYEKISSVCSGDVIPHKPDGLGYQRKGSEKILNTRNLSAGLKTFVILKMLLTRGVIQYNSTIILDEPEVHLHPEWQLLFAELIVLIQKEFDLHVLLNTHSPYFLDAIEVYASKHGVDDKCRYYLASSQDNIARIEDVTDHIEAIYSKLAHPLQDLENERGRL